MDYRNPYRDPEPPITPPDVPERVTFCPVCGEHAYRLYFDAHGDCFGCDVCVKSDLIDDVLEIPEDMPLPDCRYCHENEQSVYVDRNGEIRGCVRCVTSKET